MIPAIGPTAYTPGIRLSILPTPNYPVTETYHPPHTKNSRNIITHSRGSGGPFGRSDVAIGSLQEPEGRQYTETRATRRDSCRASPDSLF